MYVENWKDADLVKQALTEKLDDMHSTERGFLEEFASVLRRSNLTYEQALEWVGTMRPQEHNKCRKECLRILVSHRKFDSIDCDLEEGYRRNVSLMKHRYWYDIEERERRKIVDAALNHDDDRRDLGVQWLVGWRQMENMFHFMDIMSEMRKTHAVDFLVHDIFVLDDESKLETDAWLFNRIQNDLPMALNSSHLTAQFFVAAGMIKNLATPTSEKVRLASEMLLQIVGWQSRREQRDGENGYWLAVTKMSVVNWLVAAIENAMTPENAGVVLRYAINRRRHREWLWNRLVKAMKSKHWRMAKVVKIDDGVGIRYMVHGETVIVKAIQTDDVGELLMNRIALIPGTRQMKTPTVNNDGAIVYEATIQPLMEATEQMRDNQQ